jgi:hypothetical protein
MGTDSARSRTVLTVTDYEVSGKEALMNDLDALNASVAGFSGSIMQLGETVKAGQPASVFGKLGAFLQRSIVPTKAQAVDKALSPRALEALSTRESWVKGHAERRGLFTEIINNRAKMVDLNSKLQETKMTIQEALAQFKLDSNGNIEGTDTNVKDLMRLYVQKPQEMMKILARLTDKACDQYALDSWPDVTILRIKLGCLLILQSIKRLSRENGGPADELPAGVPRT